MNDTSKAIEFLKINNKGLTNGWHTVEAIALGINNNCGIPALARNLRRKREQGILVSRVREGKRYVEYSFNPASDYMGASKTLIGIKGDTSIWLRLKEIVGL